MVSGRIILDSSTKSEKRYCCLGGLEKQAHASNNKFIFLLFFLLGQALTDLKLFASASSTSYYHYYN